MVQVNMLEAKTDLSKLIRMLETQEEDIIYIARNGVEIAQLTLIPKADSSKRIGIAKDKIILPDSFDEEFDRIDSETADMFGEGSEI
ncbi:MAG: type II toxin-antitoxin system Phd/YefM family antitoxin [Oscillospiraceae bacterium]